MIQCTKARSVTSTVMDDKHPELKVDQQDSSGPAAHAAFIGMQLAEAVSQKSCEVYLGKDVVHRRAVHAGH